MKTQAEALAELKTLLTERIADPAAYVATVRGKPLKREFRQFVEQMEPGDELWEWEWRGMLGPRNSYSLGWCVLRGGEAVASYCHSYS